MKATLGLLAMPAALVLAAAAFAANPGAKPAAPPPASQPSSSENLERLIGQMKENPLIEPTQHPAGTSDAMPAQTMRVGVDPNVIGTAPGAAAALRREGEFIVSRRGRLSRSPDGSHRIFVFDSDSEKAPEAPMILNPCLMLQSMEELTEERGDRIRFNVTGQILQYRGANYLMVTMYTLVEEHNNIQK